MKWYLAARTKHINTLTTVTKFLEDKQQRVLSNWIYSGNLQPLALNLEKAQLLSREVVSGILQAEVFVLISDPEGTDMFVELGCALAKQALSNDIRIYIVGEHSKRSLMQLHPEVVHVAVLADVFEKESIDYKDFLIPTFL